MDQINQVGKIDKVNQWIETNIISNVNSLVYELLSEEKITIDSQKVIHMIF